MKKVGYANAPQFFGCYRVFFEDREDEDRMVNVLVLEYCKGKKLSKIIENTEDLSADYLENLLNSLYSSLHKLHDNGLCHRHTLPRKCIVKRNGAIIWTDFAHSTFLECSEENETNIAKKEIDIANISEVFVEIFEKKGIDFRFDDEGTSPLQLG
jgi:serine/threonine protein kinase